MGQIDFFGLNQIFRGGLGFAALIECFGIVAFRSIVIVTNWGW